MDLNQLLIGGFHFAFGHESRAFESSLTPFTLASYDTIACYSTTCANDHLALKITFGSDSTLFCSYGISTVMTNRPFTFTGSLHCPVDI